MKRLTLFCAAAFILITGAAAAKVAPLKQSEIDEIARVSNIPVVKQLELKAISRFQTPKAKVTLISGEDAKPTASIKTFKIAHRLFEEIADKRLVALFLFPEKNGVDLVIGYNVRPSIAKRRYVVFLPWKPSGAPSAFTSTRPEKPFLAVPSFFVHVDQPTRFDPRVEGDLYNVFVETCNQAVSVSVTPRSERELAKLFRKRYPNEKISDADLSRVIRLVQVQTGQELTCNSFAAAISFAWTGIPYGEYGRIMSQARLTNLGQKLSGYYLVVSSKMYAKFKNLKR